ncbi:ribbon-helix-helix protein, CopG family [candidate division WWE3 bacterium]|nr:ribbon-helix-helix protein, CopG family [candidate division WWE3 bacterium]
MSPTIRVSEGTMAKIRQLAEELGGVTMSQLVDDAVEAYRRQKILEEANRQYALIRDQEPGLHPEWPWLGPDQVLI